MGRNIRETRRWPTTNVAAPRCAATRLQMERLEDRLALAGMPEIIGDVSPDPTLSGLDPTATVEADGFVYFAAKSGTTTNALWRSDGTAGGTVLVRDLYSGNSIESLTNVGGRLFFVSEQTLWTSDGTAEGTQPLGAQLRKLNVREPYVMANVGGTLFFSGYDAAHGNELWRSDGTAEGTFMVRDIAPNGLSSNPDEIVDLNGIAYFEANDGTPGRWLWRSDGGAAGTELAVDRVQGAASGAFELTIAGDSLFFVDLMGQVWRTAAGESEAQPVVPGGATESIKFYNDLVSVNGAVYFVATGSSTGREIWTVDAGSTTARLLKDIYPGSSWGPVPGTLANVGGALYFTAGISVQQLWKSDGTAEGTAPIVSIPDGISDRLIVAAGDRAFFKSGTALWTSDGTAAGTVSLGDRTPTLLTALGSTVIFGSVGSSGARELWQSDGTLEGTAEVGYRTLRSMLYGHPAIASLDGVAYFSQRNSLWRTDGTEAGTTLAFELNAGSTTSWIRNLIEIGGVLYIGSDNGADEYQLWKSDGTLAGTELVYAIQETGAGRNAEFYNVNGTLMFVHAVAGPIVALPNTRLWSSDGTEAGTFVIRGLPNYRDYGGSQVMGEGGKLYLSLPGEAEQLWQSDGTLAGTMPVRQALGVPAGVQLGIPVQTGDSLVFPANDGVHGWEPWKKVGANSPYLLADINPGPSNGLLYSASTFSVRFHAAGDTFYFGANDGVHGYEPWRSDGAQAGTYMLRDVRPGSDSSHPTQFAPNEQAIYFRTFESEQRKGLWTSDGSRLGTSRIDGLQSYNHSPKNGLERSYVFDGMLYFTATDDVHGLELWRSDGVASMEFLGDLAVGDSVPRGFTEINGKLLFFATNDQTGVEMYVIRSRADGGDYDGNGIVDGGDFLAWQRQFSATATPAGSGADADGDGAVGAGDLEVWRSNFGLKTPAASNSPVVDLAAVITPPNFEIETNAIAAVSHDDAVAMEPTAMNRAVEERSESTRQTSWWADLHGRRAEAAPLIVQQVADDRRPLWLKRNHAASVVAKRAALLEAALTNPMREVAPTKLATKPALAADFNDLDDRSFHAIALEETQFWRE